MKVRNMITGSRAAALEALLQVSENEGYSNIVIDKCLKKHGLDKRDSALASIIFYGVLENKIRLDYYISLFLKNKSMKLSETTRTILQIGCYQIFFLDKIPESAAVNECVELAKHYKCNASFINAVLRNIIRKKEEITLPDNLEIKFSVPHELISMWKKAYGEENTLKILVSVQEKSKIYCRVNNTKTALTDFLASFADSDITVKQYKNMPHTCTLNSSGDLTKLQQYEDGLFHVQDLSSQYLCEIVDPNEDEILVDVCAAPGGKSFTLSEKMNNTGTVYSYDLYKGRVKLIFNGAKRLGLSNIHAFVRDAAKSDTHGIVADRVLCDAPCSGFGTIRRKPEIRYKTLESVKDLPDIQYEILENSSKFVKSGGYLFYSTCTLNPKENGEVADKFLANNKDFYPEDINFSATRFVDEPKNQLTMMPFNDCDGFFVAKFRRK